MRSSAADRIRGIAFLLSGIVAVGLLVYLLVSPVAFRSIHPIPLVLLLLLTVVVSAWQALVHLR